MIDPTPLSPDRLLQGVLNGLAGFASQHKALISIARDPFETLELLAESPAGLRIILHWAGDDAVSDQPQLPLAANHIEVILSLNLGLTANKDSALIAGSATRPSLLKLVSEARKTVLALEFPEEATSSYMEYEGTRPFITPEGVPLAAYKTTYTLHAAVPIAAAYQPVSFRRAL